MISTHVLDTSRGNPAEGVKVILAKQLPSSPQQQENWTLIGEEQTNNDGRIVFNCPYEPGTYRLVFEVEEYFQKYNQESFFVKIPVIFKITNTNRKYHVPLLLNPFGLSTYRGS